MRKQHSKRHRANRKKKFLDMPLSVSLEQLARELGESRSREKRDAEIGGDLLQKNF